MIKGRSKMYFLKYGFILIAVASVMFLILTFMLTHGFTFFDDWTTSSTGSIFGPSDSEVGPGPLQKHVLQILIAFFGGGSLGIAGALLQKVTKNRLAEVSILGIGSLNILFIYIYALIFKDKSFGNGVWAALMPVFLIIVSICGTFIIWLIARSKNANKNTFVIVGIALQLLVEALSVVIVNPTRLVRANAGSEARQVWNQINGYTLGKIRTEIDDPLTNPVTWWMMFLVIFIVVSVLVTIFFLRRKIDTLEVSEEVAISTGIKVKWLKLIIYLLVALLAGATSAILGTIALLGIIAPALARLIFANRTWPLILGSFLIGGLMVLIASFLAIQLDLRVAVGILSTAIIIPYFLFLLIKEQK